MLTVLLILLFVVIGLSILVPFYAIFHCIFFERGFYLEDFWNGNFYKDWHDKFWGKEASAEERSPFWHEAMDELGRLDEVMGLDFLDKPEPKKTGVAKKGLAPVTKYPRSFTYSTEARERIKAKLNTEPDLIDQIMDDLKLLDRQSFFSVRFGVYKDLFKVGTTIQEVLEIIHVKWKTPLDAIAYVGSQKVHGSKKPSAGEQIEFHKKVGVSYTCVVCGRSNERVPHTHELEEKASSLKELNENLIQATRKLNQELALTRLPKGRTASTGPKFQGLDTKRRWS